MKTILKMHPDFPSKLRDIGSVPLTRRWPTAIVALLSCFVCVTTASGQFTDARSIWQRPITSVTPSNGQALCYNSSTGTIEWATSCLNAGPAGATGATGPAGAAGAAGATGATGPAGPSLVAVTGNALIGDGSGNAIGSVGTASNCVHVDGSNGTCGSGGGSAQYTAVAFSSTPAWTVTSTIATYFTMEGANVLTGAIAPIFSGATAGQTVGVTLCQDGTGGHPVTWPAAFVGFPVISTTANTAAASSCVSAAGLFDGTNLNLVGNPVFTGLPSGANFYGSTSGYAVLKAPAVASNNTATLPGTTGTLVGTGDSAVVTAGMMAAIPKTRGIPFTIGDPSNTSALTVAATTTAYITMPIACTITAYNLLIDAGTITVKFWKIATGTAIPTSSNSINTSGVGIATGTAIHCINSSGNCNIADFTTTTVSANDIMAMNVTAVATAKVVNGVLECVQ